MRVARHLGCGEGNNQDQRGVRGCVQVCTCSTGPPCAPRNGTVHRIEQECQGESRRVCRVSCVQAFDDERTPCTPGLRPVS